MIQVVAVLEGHVEWHQNVARTMVVSFLTVSLGGARQCATSTDTLPFHRQTRAAE